MPGSFQLRPIEANLTHNTELFGKMSPYCAIQLGDKIVTSAICKRGGKNPHWEDVITMPAPSSNELPLKIKVMNKETLSSDDLVGSFSVDLREVEATGQSSKWYPLFFKNKPAGEILFETKFIGQDSAFESTGIKEESTLNQGGFSRVETDTKVYQEQKQVIEPHTFMKEVDVVETVPVTQKVEIMEPVKIMKDVEYTEAVPVTKQIETVEPQVVKKEIEVMEPRVVTKTIEVVENVPVMKEVEVIESKPVIKEVETFEPQTFHKQVEVTEYVPVTKEVTVTEPVHVKKDVEFVEDIVTTQIITKEVKQPVIVNEEVKTTVGPATLIGVEDKSMEERAEVKLIESERIKKAQF